VFGKDAVTVFHGSVLVLAKNRRRIALLVA